jgi:Na+/H+ antiporter NhaC
MQFDPIILSTVISVALLFISMVFSAMSARKAQENDEAYAHKYATVSALVSGLSVLVITIVLVMYIVKTRSK